MDIARVSQVSPEHLGFIRAHGDRHITQKSFKHYKAGGSETDVLLDIKKAVAPAKPTTGHLTKARIRDFEARYQSILDQGYAQNPLSAAPAGKKRGRRRKTKPRNLLERLDEHRQEALAFMYGFRVPGDTTWPNGTFA